MTQAAVDIAKLKYEQGEFRDIQYISTKKKKNRLNVKSVILKIKKKKNVPRNFYHDQKRF